MDKIGSVEDLMNVLQCAQREWGNDCPIRTVRRNEKGEWESSQVLYAAIETDGTVLLTDESIFISDLEKYK